MLVASVLMLGSCNQQKTPQKAPGKPNVVLILADDLGWSDISAYGGTFVSTPHIDAIGKGGVTFTQAYASAAICSPSRSGLMTGRYQQRFGHEFQIHEVVKDPAAVKAVPGGHVYAYQPENYDGVTRQGLPVSEITLAQQLKQNRYVTGMIGKWHLGFLPEFYPEARGFDYHFGFLGGGTFYSVDAADTTVVTRKLSWEKEAAVPERTGYRAIRENSRPVEVKEYLTDRLATAAVDFIEQHKDTSFFLYTAFNAPHTPVQAPKAYYDKLGHIKDPDQRAYYAMIAALDDAVGKITAKLKESGLEENTLIFFLSDNGGASYTGLTDNRPLRGGKITEFEGGVRVPFLLQWKERIPVGKVLNAPVSLLDVFTTASAAAGAALPEGRQYDGVDLFPYASGKTDSVPHQALFWRHGYQKAVRKGDWKLLLNEQSGETCLYSLVPDVAEKNNLAAAHPDKVKELKHELAQWESGLVAPLWKSWRIGNVKVGENEYYYMPL